VQSREFRNKYLPTVLDSYYEAFTAEVNAEGYDVETILPKKKFDESCKFYYDFCLLSQVSERLFMYLFKVWQVRKRKLDKQNF